MAASSHSLASKARAAPIRRADEDSDSASSLELFQETGTRFESLLGARRPRLHTIKQPFSLCLGGTFEYPHRSRTRRTEFKLIEKLPSQLRGQFRFQQDDGTLTYRSIYLQACGPAGAWRRVYTSEAYPRLVFKLSPRSDDMSYTIEEIRTFRAMPDYVSRFVQEFSCPISLFEPRAPGEPLRGTADQFMFHVLVCERLIPLSGVDLDNLHRDETVYRMCLALAAGCRAGFRPRDAGWTNWGLGIRSQRLVPLILDANSWTRLEEDHNEYGRWPGKKYLHSFWSIIKEIDVDAATHVERHVYPSRDSDELFQYLLRRLSGLNEYQQWNPFRPVRPTPDVVT